MSLTEYNSVLEYLKNYKEIARKVKEIVCKYDPHAKVYVFGSVVKGKYTAASDIDILVVSDRRDLEYKIKVEAYLKMPNAPIEIHFATREQYERWYKRFIDKIEEI